MYQEIPKMVASSGGFETLCDSGVVRIKAFLLVQQSLSAFPRFREILRLVEMDHFEWLDSSRVVLRAVGGVPTHPEGPSLANQVTAVSQGNFQRALTRA